MSRIRPRVHLDQDVYTLARERTAHLLDSFDQVSVSFSGGKDSTATLMVALEVAHSDPAFARHLPLRVVHWDEEAIPYETEEYVRRISQRDDVNLEWYCLPVQHRNACSRRSPHWWPWAPEAEALWCRPMPPEAITSLDGFPIWPESARPSIPACDPLLCKPEDGNSVQLLGIRAHESITRMRAVSTKAVDNYIVRTGTPHVWKAYPIYDWVTEDVWTAPAVKGWDYNRAYDRLEMAGVAAYHQRCSPAFGEEPIRGLSLYAQCFPDVWDKMIDRVPGVGAAARYARTELYGWGAYPEKPAGVTWPEFILHYLGKHGPDVQTLIARKIRGEITAHYRTTTDPVLVGVRHPATGLSWNHLLRLAMRGDFKERNRAVNEIPKQHELPGAWQRYTAELARVLADGEFADLAAPGPAPADVSALIPAHLREDPTP